jgi:leucyl-tRNA synthetase
MWQLLRKNSAGHHFRRQHIIDRYIPDFVCLTKKLIVEVDGKIHDYTTDTDAERTSRLQDLGYEVIRFTNERVLNEGREVLKQITETLARRPDFSVGNDLVEVTSLSRREAGREVSSRPSGEGKGGVIEVFTTRPDTIFGVSFMVLAPEHELVAQITTAAQKAEVEAYIAKAKARSDRDRMADVKTVSGAFTGAYAAHPFTGAPIPIWIGDYVLAGYGTGAIMAVPSGDERDHRFAKHFNLPIPNVIEGTDVSEAANESKDGTLINSDFLNGLKVKDAIKRAISRMEEMGMGKGRINYRLRDAVFGRQRYWGEPIPIYYKDGIPYPVKEEHLPITLPEIDEYLPTETGEPPLGRAKGWGYDPERGALNGSAHSGVTPLPRRGDGGEVFPFELSTMPGWAGSSWYFLRYMDPHNTDAFASKEAIDYWQNVDLYVGGSEHATGHLLYVRFWTMFLHDLGHLPFDEPAKKLVNQGMIQGRSNFVYREKGTGQFVSRNLIKTYTTSDFHVDVNIVENDVLDIEKFRQWREEYANAEFILEDGKYICGWEVEKMSKSKWNVVNPDDIISKYGADTLRLYEMFLGPLEDAKPWNTNGIEGTFRFLRKFWNMFHAGDVFRVSDEAPTKAELKALHATIKKVEDDIEKLSLNTSVSQFMICVNELTDLKCHKRAVLEPLTIVLSSFAPHICEELWQQLGHAESITFATYPKFEAAHLVEDTFSYPISFNGKVRLNIDLPATLAPAEVEAIVMANADVIARLEGATPKKVIVVPKRIVNVVV